MNGAGAPPQAGPAGADFFPLIQLGGDPSVAPGRPAPVGTRGLLADGTAAWDKTGTADTAWTPIDVGGGGTISHITSADGSVVISAPGGPTTDLSVPEVNGPVESLAFYNAAGHLTGNPAVASINESAKEIGVGITAPIRPFLHGVANVNDGAGVVATNKGTGGLAVAGFFASLSDLIIGDDTCEMWIANPSYVGAGGAIGPYDGVFQKNSTHGGDLTLAVYDAVGNIKFVFGNGRVRKGGISKAGELDLASLTVGGPVVAEAGTGKLKIGVGSWAQRQFAFAQSQLSNLVDNYVSTSLYDSNFNLGETPPVFNDPTHTLGGRYFSGGVFLVPATPGGSGAVSLGENGLTNPIIMFPHNEPWMAAVRVYTPPLINGYVNFLSMQSIAGGNDSLQVWANATVSADTLQLSLWKGGVETRAGLGPVGQLNGGTIAPNAFFDIQLLFDPLAGNVRAYFNGVLAFTQTNLDNFATLPLYLESDSSGPQYLIDELMVAYKDPTT